MKLTDIQKKWRKQLREEIREEKKKIEAILHPCPKFGNIEILHEHKKNGKILFDAWDGDNPLWPMDNRRFLSFNRDVILTHPDFYKLYDKDFKWLAGIGE